MKGEDSNAIGKLELTINLAFAEEERDKISERTKGGFATRKTAKAHGTKARLPGTAPKTPTSLMRRLSRRPC